jgi:branched-chain amino acid transport system substrate-binding protein
VKPIRLTRRATLIGSLAIATQVTAQVSKRDIRWVQLADVSSANGRNGMDMLLGGRMALDEVNARGGVYGRRIEVEPLDTRGDAARMNELLGAVKQRSDVFGVFSIRGTVETMAAIKSLPGWPIFGSSSGADPVRRSVPPNVFFMRATWGAEVDRLLAVAKQIGLTRIGVVYPEGPVGQIVQSLTDGLVRKQGLGVAAVATIPHPASLDVGPAAEMLARSDAQLVIVALTGPAADFMLAARRAGVRAPLYTLSDAIGPDFLNKVKEQSKGIGFSSAVPSPWDRTMLISRDYQDAMARAKKGPKDYSFPSMEGYLNGRLLIEVFKRVGPDVTRERFIETARSLKITDFGGLGVDFGRAVSALTYTDVFVISSSGRVLR